MLCNNKMYVYEANDATICGLIFLVAAKVNY